MSGDVSLNGIKSVCLLTIGLGEVGVVGMGILELLLGRGLPPVDVLTTTGFGGVPGKWPATVSLRVKTLVCEMEEDLGARTFEAPSVDMLGESVPVGLL